MEAQCQSSVRQIKVTPCTRKETLNMHMNCAAKHSCPPVRCEDEAHSAGSSLHQEEEVQDRVQDPDARR